MSRIISIGTAVPAFGTDQNVIVDFMLSAYDNDVASRKLNILFNQSGISTRYAVIPDFDKSRTEKKFYADTSKAPSVENRLTAFKEQAIPLAIEAIEESFKKINSTIDTFGITHLITVSCTGIYAPGMGAELIEKLNLPDDIFHTAVNFLGCNAAFHALKIANLIAESDESAKVLIVCVELCSLHFQPRNNHDNLLSNTIFGDGAAAVIITSDAYAIKHQKKGLEINGFYSLLIHKGKNLMGWNITPVNFEMILDAKIPELISNEVQSVIQKACMKYNIAPETINKWAIHPGGRKIIDVIKKKLELTDEDSKASYKVLNEYGNMSSPTILFVLNELMNDNKEKRKTIFSIGFAPGLSIETALLTYA